MSRISIGRLLKRGWMLLVARFSRRGGTVASINYLDVNAQPQRVDDTVLPKSYDVTTTEPAVFAHLVMANADTFCLDKSG